MNTSLVLLLFASISSCIGNLLVKYSRINLDDGAGFIGQYFSAYFIAGVMFYFINLLAFAKALDNMPVSIAYPILAASGFGLLAISSAIILGETLGMPQYIGLVLVVAGICLLAMQPHT